MMNVTQFTNFCFVSGDNISYANEGFSFLLEFLVHFTLSLSMQRTNTHDMTWLVLSWLYGQSLLDIYLFIIIIILAAIYRRENDKKTTNK